MSKVSAREKRCKKILEDFKNYFYSSENSWSRYPLLIELPNRELALVWFKIEEVEVFYRITEINWIREDGLVERRHVVFDIPYTFLLYGEAPTAVGIDIYMKTLQRISEGYSERKMSNLLNNALQGENTIFYRTAKNYVLGEYYKEINSFSEEESTEVSVEDFKEVSKESIEIFSEDTTRKLTKRASKVKKESR